MDIKMTAINLALLACLFVPYYLIFILGQRSYRNLNKRFKQEVRKNNLKIDEKQNWSSNLIGIDIAGQKLLFVQSRTDGFAVDLIDLSNVKSSQVYGEYKQQKINGTTENLLQRVFLETQPVFGDERIRVKLYDSDLIYYEDYELKNAEKWCGIINKNLRYNPFAKRVA